jgi:histidine triad (HIT) family protein
MATIFSKIISGEIPCFKIAEDDKFLAFLDIMPLRKGHALVIPKKETDYIFDMEDAELAEMMIFAKSISHKIKKVFPCRKIGVTVIGLEVPHAHIHLIPINGIADMNFAQEKLTLSKEELAQIAQDIQNA